jgi:hypothetical protein
MNLIVSGVLFNGYFHYIEILIAKNASFGQSWMHREIVRGSHQWGSAR